MAANSPEILGHRQQRSMKAFVVVALAAQVSMLFLYGLFAEYAEDAKGASAAEHSDNVDGMNASVHRVDRFYPMWQDVHGMMFIGFGFLMAFLYRYGYSSIGLNFLLGAFTLQWATLVLGFFRQHTSYDSQVAVNIEMMLSSDFAAAAVMITFGAVLGKVSAAQLLVIAMLEIVFFAANEMVGVKELQAADIGGSMFVHTFGAYFGLALTRVLASRTRHARRPGSDKETAVYNSDLFAMIGTLILWLYWPSFNAAVASGDRRHRAVLNTYYSLAACAVVTFAISSLVDKNSKLNMVHIQNATLAGGVAIGTSADFLLGPWVAILVGMVAAAVSVCGYKHVQPYLQKTFHIHDTCGVHNLHGMPGVLAAVVSIIATVSIDRNKYGSSLGDIYPAMNANGSGRSRSEQALYQLATLGVTLGVAIVGGIITGYIVRWEMLNPPTDDDDELFSDEYHWMVAEDTLQMTDGQDGGPVVQVQPEERAEESKLRQIRAESAV